VQVPRWGAAAVQAGGSVCVFGGRGAATTALSSVERFDPATGTWEPLPPLKVPRKSGDPALQVAGSGRHNDGLLQKVKKL